MTTIGTLYDYLRKTNPKHGRLTYVSPTALSFKPFGGDAIKVNGVIRTIPPGGIAGLANTNVRVDGVAGQNLAASRNFLVCVSDVGGVLTADFMQSSSLHIPSTTPGNIGVEVYTSDGTTPNDIRSLIGMVRTNASSQFVDSQTQRFVISWFNRRLLPLQGALTPGIQTSAATVTELSVASRVQFLTWASTDECVQITVSGQGNASAANYARISVSLDATSGFLPGTQLDMLYLDRFGGNSYVSISNIYSIPCSEGYHYLTPVGAGPSIVATFYVFVSAMIRG